jgi:hypothetical protein
MSNLSRIVFLSDCTPVYRVLGTPGKITEISGVTLKNSIRINWRPPANTNDIPVDYYNIRYGKYGVPGDLVNGFVTSIYTTALITNLVNGWTYSFWISGVNNFGEGVLSQPYSTYAGSTPDIISLVRRSFRSSTNTRGIGIEFVPPLNYNGATNITYTIKYTRMDGSPLIETSDSFTQLESVQTNEIMVDICGNNITNTNGYMGNYVRREINIANDLADFMEGTYKFQVLSTNMFGSSLLSQMSFSVYLSSSAIITTPSFGSLPSGDILGVVPLDSSFRFQWGQYTGVGANSNWSYRIQYTDNKNYWYYPTSNGSSYYPEYTINYDASKINYSIDINKNVVNGRRYYIRYCVVNQNGDTSQYTQVTETNLNITSVIPGRLPPPPQIFRAAVDDRTVHLYFNWEILPPSLELTGGYPILDYRIERYRIMRVNGYSEEYKYVINNVAGPFYSDNFDIRLNGIEYLYRIYSRNEIGYSLNYMSVYAIPVRKSDIVHDVTVVKVDYNQITLSWLPPNNIDPGMPLNQYYIEYKTYTNTNLTDLNTIIVNDTFWSQLPSSSIKIFTKSLSLSYTITGLTNGTVYVFRVAAVTQDSVRRIIVGLTQIIGRNSPYILHPIMIGRVPSRITNLSFINGDGFVNIKWTSTDLTNTEGIIQFIVDYKTANSGEDIPFTRQTFLYSTSESYRDNNTIYFSIFVGGLLNNIYDIPSTTPSDSYKMTIFAENNIGFTNINQRIDLHDLRNDVSPESILFYDIYNNQKIRRYVRPVATPSPVS